MLFILFRRFTHMKARIACMQPIHISFKKYYLHPRVPLQSYVFFDFFVFMHGLWIKWFTPWWRRPCTYLHQPCFKEYHSRLKLLLKGFHLVVSLSSVHNFLYLLNRTSHSCKSLWHNSIFLSKKVYNETCLRVIISSFGCLSCIFLMVLSNFLRGCSKPWEHQQNIDTYLDGVQPNLKLCNILLNLLLLLLKDVGCNKSSIKPQKQKTKLFR